MFIVLTVCLCDAGRTKCALCTLWRNHSCTAGCRCDHAHMIFAYTFICIVWMLKTLLRYMATCFAGDHSAQIACSNPQCRVVLMYPRGASQVQCSLCHTINNAMGVSTCLLVASCAVAGHPCFRHIILVCSSKVFNVSIPACDHCLSILPHSVKSAHQ